MATGIIMPKAGMAMESGVIVSWLKQIGDYVDKGEPVLEVETDKVTIEVEAETSGYLLKILHDEGDEVPVTEVIGYLGEEGEEVQEDDAHGATPAAPAADTTPDRDTRAPAPAFAGGTASTAGTAADSAAPRPRATPKARRLAAGAGIELASVVGSGPGGAVQARDVEAARVADAPGGRPAAASAEGAPLAGAALPRGVTRQPLSRLRRTIARNTAASHAAVPAVTLNGEANVTELLTRREGLPNGHGVEGVDSTGAVRPSVNDLVTYAVSRVLRNHPRVNAHLDGEALLVFDQVNLGVAVAVEEGLVVPVIAGAEGRGLADLAAEGRRLAEAARADSLKPGDLEGATFTVTNLGMYGISSFNPIINLPQVGILGVGTVTPRLARTVDGNTTEGRFMTLSFTFDHRAMDGAQAARFLRDLRSLLEKADAIIPPVTQGRGTGGRREGGGIRGSHKTDGNRDLRNKKDTT